MMLFPPFWPDGTIAKKITIIRVLAVTLILKVELILWAIRLFEAMSGASSIKPFATGENTLFGVVDI